MPSRRARTTLAIVLVSTVAAIAATLAVPQGAAARSSMGARLSVGTGVMSAVGPGLHGTIDVASVNSHKKLSYGETLADVHRVAARADVIGFQEGQKWPAAQAYESLTQQGWQLIQDRDERGRSELAVAWRSDRFRYVRHAMRKVHERNRSDAGDHQSYPARYVLAVDLLHLGSGKLLTVLNTHVNHYIERHADDPRQPGRPYDNINAEAAKRHLRALAGMVADAGTRWTVVTGDFNWGYAADQRERHPDFLHGRVGPVAVSSFESLGLDGTASTHPRSRRYIDYVFLARNAPAGFTRQEVLDGLNSDHRAVIATVALN